jgi:hypothetical protein
MGFLGIIAILNFALVDLIALEMIISLIFVVDKGGHVKMLVSYLTGKSEAKDTEWYVFGVIIIGLVYFFLTNLYQDNIIAFLVNIFGWWLLLLFPTLLSFVIFWISKFTTGRDIEFRLCKYPLIIFGVLTLLLIIILVAKYYN